MKVSLRIMREIESPYMMDEPKIQTQISALPLKDKAKLTAGVAANKTYGAGPFRPLVLSDGPSGVRMLNDKGDSLSGVDDSLPSTVFPVGSTLACSWDEENFRLEGEAIGQECAHYGADVLLGPALNIQRNPLCGRNFEYYSEDPLLSGLFAASFVRGVQSQGVGACLKHYACNGNETYRFVGDSLVSERALSEIYLRNFALAVKEGHPYAVMTAYNQVNHVYCSESSYLLKKKLRGEFGFDGFVMTDWGGTHDKVEGIRNGLNLEMPGCTPHNVRVVAEAVEKGTLSSEELDEALLPMQLVSEKTKEKANVPSSVFEDHVALAEKLCLDGAVLLRNENGALPLNPNKSYAVIGDFFEHMRYQGSGSSMLNPHRLLSFQEAFKKRSISYSFAPGYLDGEGVLPKKEEEALALCKGKDAILFFGGLSDFGESEGFDKTDLKLPAAQTHLLSRLLETGLPVIFVLFTGTPVELDGFDKVSAILDLGLGGETLGEAGAKLLFGEANPSGHLCQSWPFHYEDVPLAKEFASSPVECYKDDVYCGYRYYETVSKKVRYPFGYGLSYTHFELLSWGMERKENSLHFTAKVKNAGGREGKTVLQAYVQKPRVGPIKELVSFAKTSLLPGEEKTIEWDCPLERLESYSESKKALALQKGTYHFFLGFSVEEVSAPLPMEIQEGEEKGFDAPLNLKRSDEEYCRDIGVEYRPHVVGKRPYTLETPISEFKTGMGRFFAWAVCYFGGKTQYKKGKKMKDPAKRSATMKAGNFVMRLMPSNSLRSLCYSSSGMFGYEIALLMEGMINHRLFRGLNQMRKEKKENKKYGK